MIDLGFIVRDKVTGLVGVAESRAEYMYGCDRYYVQPRINKDGKVPGGHMVDAPQLELVEPHEQVMAAAPAPDQLIEMGQLVEDPITGVSGTATGRAVYLNGCSRIYVTPPRVSGADEKSAAAFWADERQLTGHQTFFGKKAKVPVKPDTTPARRATGGPAPSSSKY